MEIVGVIQYRLVGNHPAAQGRNTTTSFPGETISLAEVLAKLVRENTINEDRYKLEVVRLTSPPGSSVTTTEPITTGTILQNYDRITVNISTLQFQEALATAEEAKQRDEALREREGELAVEAAGAMTSFAPIRRLEDERGAPTSLIATAAAVLSAGSASAARAQDVHELERATRVAARRFPVAPGKPRREGGALAARADPRATDDDDAQASRDEVEADAVCDLCELPPFEPRVLPCCGSTVCTSCCESASLMTLHEGDCPVCGRPMGTSAASSTPAAHGTAYKGSGRPSPSSTKAELTESKLFAHPLPSHVGGPLAAAHVSRTSPPSNGSTSSSRASPHGMLTPSTDRDRRTASSGRTLSEAPTPRSVGGTSMDSLTRPACVDGDLLVYEKKLQQCVPALARFLLGSEPPVTGGAKSA